MRRIQKIVKSERGVFEVGRNEEDAIEEIMQLLALNRVAVWRSLERIPKRNKRGVIIGRFQTAGLPDLQGFVISGDAKEGTHYALPYWIEVKGPKGQLRPAQREFLEQYQAMGFFAFMARTWEEVKAEFAKRGIKLKVG